MSFGRRKPRVDERRAADPQAVRAAALALLARREYASAELGAALARKGYASEAVAEVTAALREELESSEHQRRG